ncbi:hypothetical protein GCM10022267_44010 [Lentzea roselyniae]|uniref:Uncharacterized protein n=1 Tax=Lentzea roselyniae TaxID=531940 RepID=A0ABP7B8K7_9PSEU
MEQLVRAGREDLLDAHRHDVGPGRLDLFTVGRAAASRGPNRIDSFVTGADRWLHQKAWS